MPQLPTAFDLGERPTPQPSQAVVPIRMGQEAAALGQIGQDVLDYQKQQDVTQVNDTYANDFSPKFRKLYGQFYSLRGKDAIDAQPLFEQQMQELRNQARDALPDFQQKRLFDDMSRRRIEIELDSMAKHVGTERANWQNNTYVSSKKNFLDELADKANDDVAFHTVLGNAEAMIAAQAATAGKGGAWAAAEKSALVGEAWANNVQAKIIGNDPFGAQATYNAHQHEMPAHLRLQLGVHLKAAVDPQLIRRGVDSVMTAPPPSVARQEVANPDAFVQSIRVAESGGNMAAVGGKGELSDMQVLPATAKNPGFGIAPAANDTPQEYSRVGKALAPALLNYYGGNQILAAAAYNAGFPTVDKWIAKYGDPRTGAVSDSAFAAAIPYAGTQAYVRRVAMPGYSETPAGKSDVRAMLGTWEQKVDEWSQSVRPGDLVFRDQARADLRTRVAGMASALDGQQKQAADIVMGAVGGAKGQPPITSFSQIQSDPVLMSAYLQLGGTAQAGIQQHILSNNMHQGTRSKPGLEEDVLRRMYLEPGDPNLIHSPAQLLAMVDANGNGLAAHQLPFMQAQLAVAQSPDSKPLGKRVQDAMIEAHRNFAQDPLLTMSGTNPYAVSDAMSGLRAAFDAKRKAYEKSGGDVSDLLPGGKANFFTSANVRSFAQGGKAAVAQAATVAAAAVPLDMADPEGSYERLKPGAAYSVVLPDGRTVIRQKPGAAAEAPAPAQAPPPKPAVVAPQPNPVAVASDAFEKETREIESGKRSAYSPATIAALESAKTQKAAASRKAEADQLKQEQERQLARSRELARGK